VTCESNVEARCLSVCKIPPTVRGLGNPSRARDTMSVHARIRPRHLCQGSQVPHNTVKVGTPTESRYQSEEKGFRPQGRWSDSCVFLPCQSRIQCHDQHEDESQSDVRQRRSGGRGRGSTSTAATSGTKTTSAPPPTFIGERTRTHVHMCDREDHEQSESTKRKEL
jgi:hypothetical protein